MNAARATGDRRSTRLPDRSLPPAVDRTAPADGCPGYVVPVMSGTFDGELRVGGDDCSLDGATGYHDHNWGFWEGVRWQWGQVAGHDSRWCTDASSRRQPWRTQRGSPVFSASWDPRARLRFQPMCRLRKKTREPPKVITVHARGPNAGADAAVLRRRIGRDENGVDAHRRKAR